MKAVICGAGDVGVSIARYLSQEKHQVVLIDTDQKKLNDLECDMDIQTVNGYAASPEVLENAGARDADLIVAVTRNDEVNMIACMEGASLFNIPLKIARIRSGFYAEPSYEKLIREMHIDVVISPEVEIAGSILRNLKIPGALEYIQMHNKKIAFLGAKCLADAPLIGSKPDRIFKKFSDFPVQTVAILRDNQPLSLNGKETLKAGDEVYLLLPAKYANDVLEALGQETHRTRKIVIFGGGRVGMSLAKMIEEEGISTDLSIIEESAARAVYLAGQLKETLVIRGNGLEKNILKEADIQGADASVAVSGVDEDNILLSLLAKQYAVGRTFALVNNPVYGNLVSQLGVDIIINPNALTISTILQHIRKGQVQSIYSLRSELGELMEIQVLETSKIVGSSIEKVSKTKGIQICGLIRNSALVPLHQVQKIEVNDIVIVLAAPGHFKAVEKLFSAGLYFF